MHYWKRKGEYSELKLDGNNNSTMVRYESIRANSTIKSMDIVCEGLTRFSFDVRPSLNSRDDFKSRLIEIGEDDTMPGDWNRKVFANNKGDESTDATEYPPASLMVNIGKKNNIQKLNNLFQAAKEFSPEREKSDFEEMESEIISNIDRMRCKLGKRSRNSFERG